MQGSNGPLHLPGILVKALEGPDDLPFALVKALRWPIDRFLVRKKALYWPVVGLVGAVKVVSCSPEQPLPFGGNVRLAEPAANKSFQQVSLIDRSAM